MARASLDAVGETSYISEAFADPKPGTQVTEVQRPTPTVATDRVPAKAPALRRGITDPITIDVSRIRKLTKHRVPMREIDISLPVDLLQVAEELEDRYRQQMLLHISWTRVLEVAVEASCPSPEYGLDWVLFRTLRFPAADLVAAAGKRTHRAVMSEHLAGWLGAIADRGFVLL